MLKAKRTVDDRSIALSNRINESQIKGVMELAVLYFRDPEKEARMLKCLCMPCHYREGQMAGAAMTEQPCADCETVQRFSSTNTDILCEPCARIRNLCKHCGATL